VPQHIERIVGMGLLTNFIAGQHGNAVLASELRGAAIAAGAER
jgi:hypothetical protein